MTVEKMAVVKVVQMVVWKVEMRADNLAAWMA